MTSTSQSAAEGGWWSQSLPERGDATKELHEIAFSLRQVVYFGLERPAPNSADSDGPQDAEGLQAIARAARQTVSEQVIRPQLS